MCIDNWEVCKGAVSLREFPWNQTPETSMEVQTQFSVYFTGICASIIQRANVISNASQWHSSCIMWGCAGGSPDNVSADKGQEAGNALGFGTKLEGLQFTGIPLWVI